MKCRYWSPWANDQSKRAFNREHRATEPLLLECRCSTAVFFCFACGRTHRSSRLCLHRNEVLIAAAVGSVVSPLLAGPVETEFGTHLIYVESCNKPENTWKMMYDDVVKKVTGGSE